MNNRKKEYEKYYAEESKKRLKKIVDKKIEITMIGSLNAIEEAFGHLWNHGDSPETKEELEMYNIYSELRSKILRLGNDQRRKLDDEFSRNTVVWNKYQLTLPVINKDNEEGQENE